MQQIPITSSPQQYFDISLNIDGKNLTLNFFIAYNEAAESWYMNISDKNKNPLINSVPLLVGQNLLKQYSYLAIGAAYLIKIDNIEAENPDSTNLGTSFILLWGDTE